jgi:hypothetical protein
VHRFRLHMMQDRMPLAMGLERLLFQMMHLQVSFNSSAAHQHSLPIATRTLLLRRNICFITF